MANGTETEEIATMSIERDDTDRHIMMDDSTTMDETENDVYKTYQTSAFNGLFDRWLIDSQDIAQWCIHALYDDATIDTDVSVVDMDDQFDSENDVREYLSDRYRPEMWVDPRHSDFDLQWDAHEISHRRETQTQVQELDIECQSWCWYYAEYVCTAIIEVRFIRDKSQIMVTDTPVIMIQDPDDAV